MTRFIFDGSTVYLDEGGKQVEASLTDVIDLLADLEDVAGRLEEVEAAEHERRRRDEYGDAEKQWRE